MNGTGVPERGTDAPHAADAMWHELALSSEQEALSDSVSRHLSRRFPLTRLRELMSADAIGAPAWDEIVSAGYQSIGLPESAGGAGSLVDMVVVLEQAGRALLPLPLFASVASLQTRAVAGLLEAGDDARPSALGTTDGALVDCHLSVRDVAVLDGAAVSSLTIVVGHGRDCEVAVIDLGSAQVRPAVTHTHVDATRPLASYDFDDVAVDRIGQQPGDIDAILAPARVALAADLTGVAAGAFDQTLEHVRRREQFGQALGTFQAIKHRLADVYVLLERARTLTRAAAVALSRPEVDAEATRDLPMLAKAAAAEVGLQATAVHIQMLGALGATFESDAHLFFRRALQTAPFLGTPAHLYEQVARAARRGSR